MDFNLGVNAIAGLFLLIGYLIHFVVAYSRHSQLMETEEIKNRLESLPIGTTWFFFLATIGLPLFCSLCAGWVTNPVIPVENIDVVKMLPAPFFNVAISIFILMITIEIGFLYNDSALKWRAFIQAALILDLIALLTFLVVVKPPTAVIEASSGLLIFFFILVAIASLVSSCATIYFAKIHSVID
jgi:hypothetical protein